MNPIARIVLSIFVVLFAVGCSQVYNSTQINAIQNDSLQVGQTKLPSSVQCDDRSAVQYAKSFYQDHYYFFADPAPKMADQLYTADFKQVIINHAECVGDKGFCDLHFDPWLNSQDGYADGKIDYSVRTINENSLAVNLNYQFRVHPTLSANPQRVSLLLNRADADADVCWKMDDMLLPDESSMKAMMKRDYLQFYYYKKSRLSWTLLASDVDSSDIAVMRNNQLIAEYRLNCDVSESLKADPDQFDGEMNKVGLVVTPFKPQGLVISSCRVGAHSKQLSVYDLESKRQSPVWEKTGSYFGEWSVNHNYDLVLSYDEPCESQNCEVPFVQKDFTWENGP